MDKLSIDPATGRISFNINLRALINSAGNGTILPQLTKLMNGNGPAAANAELILNTQLSLTIEPKGTIAIKPKSYDTFTLFPQLPTELRLKIWREAMPGPRIVEIELCEHQGRDVEEYFSNDLKEDMLKGYHIRSVSPMPPISTFHSNRESRQESLKRYKKMFSNHDISEANFRKPIYIDPVHDTPYFSRFTSECEASYHGLISAMEDFMSSHDTYFPLEHKLINRLAFPFPSYMEINDVVDPMFQSPCLKNVILIAGEYTGISKTKPLSSKIFHRHPSFADIAAAQASMWDERESSFVAISSNAFEELRKIFEEIDEDFKPGKDCLIALPTISVERIVVTIE